MRSLHLACLVALAIPAALLAACEDDTTPSADVDGGASDSGTTDSHAGHDTGVEEDSGPPPIRCTDAEFAANDLTDGGALEITFPTAGDPTQYTNACATVKAGASVTFTGSFLNHPLEAAGGDSPNPIPYTAEDQPNNKLVVTLPSAGTYGYQCEFHPTLMYGAIRVVP